MKFVRFSSALLLALASVCIPAPAREDVPFKGEISTVVQIDQATGNIIIAGVGTVSHLGKTAVAIQQHFIDQQHVQSTLFEMTAANGDKLFAHFTMMAQLEQGPPGSLFAVSFGGTFYIDGGTGRFEGATGSAPFHGTAVNYPDRGYGEFSWEGTLSTVGSLK